MSGRLAIAFVASIAALVAAAVVTSPAQAGGAVGPGAPRVVHDAEPVAANGMSQHALLSLAGSAEASVPQSSLSGSRIDTHAGVVTLYTTLSVDKAMEDLDHSASPDLTDHRGLVSVVQVPYSMAEMTGDMHRVAVVAASLKDVQFGSWSPDPTLGRLVVVLHDASPSQVAEVKQKLTGLDAVVRNSATPLPRTDVGTNSAFD